MTTRYEFRSASEYEQEGDLETAFRIYALAVTDGLSAKVAERRIFKAIRSNGNEKEVGLATPEPALV